MYIDFDVTMAAIFFTGRNPFLKRRKITFLPVLFMFLAHFSVPALVSITFRSIFCAFLRF